MPYSVQTEDRFSRLPVMSTFPANSNFAGLLAAVALLALGGCALPAFDQSGERIFNGSTRLASIKDCPLLWVRR